MTSLTCGLPPISWGKRLRQRVTWMRLILEPGTLQALLEANADLLVRVWLGTVSGLPWAYEVTHLRGWSQADFFFESTPIAYLKFIVGFFLKEMTSLLRARNVVNTTHPCTKAYSLPCSLLLWPFSIRTTPPIFVLLAPQPSVVYLRYQKLYNFVVPWWTNKSATPYYRNTYDLSFLASLFPQSTTDRGYQSPGEEGSW
jgi:hypothetical protein